MTYYLGRKEIPKYLNIYPVALFLFIYIHNWTTTVIIFIRLIIVSYYYVGVKEKIYK